MPDVEDINRQLELLEAQRATLHHYLRQQALLGEAYVPPGVTNGIREARSEIQGLKTTLRAWEVTVEDLPGDEQSDGEEAPLTQSPTKRRRRVSRKLTIAAIVAIAIFVLGVTITRWYLLTQSTRNAPLSLLHIVISPGAGADFNDEIIKDINATIASDPESKFIQIETADVFCQGETPAEQMSRASMLANQKNVGIVICGALRRDGERRTYSTQIFFTTKTLATLGITDDINGLGQAITFPTKTPPLAQYDIISRRNKVLSLFILGYTYFAGGVYDKSVEYLEQAANLDKGTVAKGDPVVYLFLEKAYTNRGYPGDIERAQAASRQADNLR